MHDNKTYKLYILHSTFSQCIYARFFYIFLYSLWWWYANTSMVMRFCFRTLKFPPWQPSIARISEFINNHWSRVFSSSLQQLTVFLKEPANDRSRSSFSGWFFASFQKHWELWVSTKTPGLWIFMNFCGYESVLRATLI
jgi:hypothetical protein